VKLEYLFEQDLSPGERRILDIRLRDVQKISDRIQELESNLRKSKELAMAFRSDAGLQQALKNLKFRIRRKIAMLEKASRRPTDQQQAFVAQLHRECSDAIAAMQRTKSLLYRGVKTWTSQYQSRSREDREPKDSHLPLSKIFDQMLIQLGSKAIRSNSIFTTSSYSFASSYGFSVYIILPKNGFNFLSTNQRDFVLDSSGQLLDLELVEQFIIEVDEWAKVHVPDWSQSFIAEQIPYKNWIRAFRLVQDQFNYENNPMNLPPKFDVDWKTLVTPKGIEERYKPNFTDFDAAI
jgi:hypothetical protein